LTVNVPVVEPAETVTETGTTALELLELSLIEIPPVGAAPDNVTVPVEDVPPITEVGDTETPVNATELMPSVAVLLVVPWVAVIVAVVVVATAVVDTVKVIAVLPAATVTLDGTVALLLLEPRLITVPPDGATPLKVTVPVEGEPPGTDVGERLRPFSAGGVIVSTAVLETPPNAAVIVAEVEEETADVVIVNVPDIDPAATVTVAGKDALVVLDDRFTTAPPVGATALNVTVPVENDPPITDVGETVSPLTEMGGETVSVVVTVVVPDFASRVATVEVVTEEVVIANVADVAPWGTVTLAGILTIELLDDRLTTVPPLGAAS
jgi:hypothetical protein